MSERKQKTNFETYRHGGTTSPIRCLITMVLVVREFRNKMDEMLRPIGQSSARMEALGAIMNMPSPKSQTDLARRLRVENATVTRIVDILSNEGLVRREPDPNDRRVNLLSISSEGEDVLREIFTIYDTVRDHILQEVPEEEFDRLTGMFNSMLRRLNEPIEPEVRIDPAPKRNRLRD